jgi:hypothetical protein
MIIFQKMREPIWGLKIWPMGSPCAKGRGNITGRTWIQCNSEVGKAWKTPFPYAHSLQNMENFVALGHTNVPCQIAWVPMWSQNQICTTPHQSGCRSFHPN